MALGFIAIAAFMIGIMAGLGIGRFFCKWHHKADEELGLSSKLNSRYNPLEDHEDICGPVRGVDQGIATIGDELKSIKNCGCSPGCCGQPDCGDKHE